MAIWYILMAQSGSHIITLGPKYILYNYMELWVGLGSGGNLGGGRV